MEPIISHVASCRERGLTDEETCNFLRVQGYTEEQISIALSSQQPAVVQPNISGTTIVANPTDIKVDPGYLESFSWGYFGTSFVYIIAMRLPIWSYLAPIFYTILWVILRIPIALFFVFVPFGGIFFALLNIIVPLYIWYRLAHTVRTPAFYGPRKWSSDEDFVNTQDIWDL